MLYHIQVYWPKTIPTQLEFNSLQYTSHAEQRAREKGIRLNRGAKGTAFEVQIEGRTIVKYAIRCKYSDTHDLCLVVTPSGKVITQWLNSVQDSHRTLDASRYSRE